MKKGFIAICFHQDRDPGPARYHLPDAKVRTLDKFNRFLAKKGYQYYNLYDRASRNFIGRIWLDRAIDPGPSLPL